MRTLQLALIKVPEGANRKVRMFSNGFELAVEVNGRRIPEFGSRGKTFVEGRRGHRYEIKFRNNRAERVLAVPTVDGLNVIDGNPHTDSSPGYVVQPYSSMTITGWRTSLQSVNLFEFTDKGGGYAAKTHGAQNSGIIGMQVWAEHRAWSPPPPPPQEVHIHHHQWTYNQPPMIRYYDTLSSGPCYKSSLMCAGMPGPTGTAGIPGPAGAPGVSINMSCASSPSSAPDFNLGTGYGAPATDIVSQTMFEKGFWLATLEIYYSDAEGLAKDGITVSKAPTLAVFPQAFGNFCKPPPY
jgi:hypothetical protein